MIKRQSTKEILAASLMQLCKDRSIKKVTIDMIVENCNFSRKTFYNNFEGKYDLAYWIFENKSDEIIAEYVELEPWATVLGRIYEFMYNNNNIFGSAWDDQDLNNHIRRIIKYCDKYYSRRLIEINGEDVMTPEIKFLLHFNSYGATHMVIDWIKFNWSQDPYEMGKYMADAIPTKLKQLLKLN